MPFWIKNLEKFNMQHLYFNDVSFFEVKRVKDLSPKFLNGVWGDYSIDNTGTPVLRSTEQNIDGTLDIVDPAILNIKKIGKNNLLKSGDLLLTKSSGSKEHIGKCSHITIDLGQGFCFSNFMMGIRFPKEINSRFVFYCVNNILIKKQINNNSTNITLNNLTNESVGQLLVPMPAKEVQDKIVNYLDINTSKIDRKISILEQKFEKLEEYKQSVIFEAVTKGLDSSAPMKDSVINCIGDIPRHWDIKRLKDIAIINKGESFEEVLSSPEGLYPYINGGIKPSDWTNEFNTKENTIAVSEGGASAGYTQFMKTKFWAGSHCYKVHSKNKKHDNKYLYYVLKGFEKHLMIEKTGSAMPNLQKTKFINYLVSFVENIKEQNAIVAFLDFSICKIEKKEAIIKSQIKLLKEFKQSLIYEAVTGKMEVL